MASVTSLGTGSGLDLEGLLTKLMAAETAPVSILQNKESKVETKISALGTLKSALSTFQKSVDSISDVSDFLKPSATTSDKTVATIAATSDASVGSYSLQVSQLAKAQKLTTSSVDSKTDQLGTGSLTIELGSYDSSGNFVQNEDAKTASITIDSTNNTLTGVRDAINNANTGVTASIVNDGSGYVLVLTSPTGASNNMRITVDDGDGTDSDTSGLSQLAYDASTSGTKNMTQTQAGQDAKFTLDGMSMTSSSNTIKEAIEGATVTLVDTTDTGDTVSLNVTRDSSSVSTAVESFVSAYNTLYTALSELGHSTYDSSTGSVDAGDLQGDSTLRSIQSEMRDMFNATLGSSSSSDYSSIYSVGISFEKDGTMALDSDALEEALDDDPDAVAALFTSHGVTTNASVSFSKATDATSAGTYGIEVTQAATQGTLTGSALSGSSFTINSSNDSFKVKIDGTQSSSISVAEGNYTGAELAAKLQSSINADSALTKAGVSVTVTWDSTNKTFSIKSASYGSDSTVEITSEDSGVQSTLGLGVGTGTTGLDVEGTIGGFAAKGDGQTLTAIAGSAAGLAVKVDSTSSGYMGTVTFNKGVAYKLNAYLSQVLSSDGLIESKISGLNDTVTTIEEDITKWSDRLETIEARYRTRFTALDTLITSLKSTSDSLTSLLASLPNATSSSSS